MSFSSTAMNEREPPLKKMKKPSVKPISYLSLPDDLLLSCLARVSRLYYPTISLVCKRVRSLLASPELYKVRSLLGCTESCLYVCLRLNPHSDPSWFTLYRKPNQTLNNDTIQEKKKSSGYVLAPIPIPHSPHTLCNNVVAVGSTIYSPFILYHTLCNTVVAVGSTIYAIGGPINKVSSSKVSILDCRSHTWREAPSMNVERGHYATANVFDGKIYVAGGCENYDSSNWMEVFDLKSQTWELALSTQAADNFRNKIYKSGVIRGEIYMFGDNDVAYKPKEVRWEVIEDVFDIFGWAALMSSCVIDNVVYCYTKKTIKWYDSKTRYWNDVKGLESLPKRGSYYFVRLVDYGGKVVVLWDTLLPPYEGVYKEKLFSCAVIVLERRNNNNNQEIWGKIEWLDDVLTVPESYEFMCAVAATV